MFVGSQQRITLNNIDYYVDMVFYNKFLKSYVLIDLKMNKLKAENLGQMNMYLNYYEKAVNSVDDGKPIGIILCAEKDKVVLEYALGGLSNNIFASILSGIQFFLYLCVLIQCFTCSAYLFSKPFSTKNEYAFSLPTIA